ncbi:MAG: CRISPR-associated endonuclease Cas1 [Bryobacterales bacterium]|nr:CRISPR-associated endonuclease Cas1 [Bryobacterales bacterium]
MAHLYITEQGAVLRKSGDRFLVEREDQILADLPYHKLEQVALFGNIQVTTQAMAELLEKGIRLSFFSRGGRYRGALSQDSGRSVDDRLRQFEIYKDPAVSLAFARRILSAKIANGLEVLRRAAARAGGTDAFHQAADVLRHGLESLPKAEAVSSFLGIEGTCARAYFQALMSYNRSEFTWSGRKHHPAPDPLNSLLSLTYTLLVQELRGLLEGLGLDPYFGFLHELESRRPSLALDLMEPLRHPVADRFVLAIINRGEFQASDFQTREGGQGLLLSTDALKRFLAAYERWMLVAHLSAGKHLPPFRQVLKNEAEDFLGGLRKPETWKPFHYEQYNDGEEGNAAHRHVRSSRRQTPPPRIGTPARLRPQARGERVLHRRR